jgi:methenyltetrahydrofolate cyclohydrolase
MPMRIEQQTIVAFLNDLAAKSPTPGGGTVAALTGALAAALARMVVNYSVGKKSLEAFNEAHRRSLLQLESCTARAMDLAEADAVAYARMNDLWRLDAADPKRVREYPAAVQAAIDAPLAVLDSSIEMLDLLGGLVTTTNKMLASDLAIAAILADAAARSAAWNVRINLPQVGDAGLRNTIERHVAQALAKGKALSEAVERACQPA